MTAAWVPLHVPVPVAEAGKEAATEAGGRSRAAWCENMVISTCSSAPPAPLQGDGAVPYLQPTNPTRGTQAAATTLPPSLSHTRLHSTSFMAEQTLFCSVCNLKLTTSTKAATGTATATDNTVGILSLEAKWAW